jgi:hypothetical protein
MKSSLKFSILMLIVSSVFLLITATSGNSMESLDLNNCFHCGTIAACEDGGQAYGWTNCVYLPYVTPPDNCLVYGTGGCGM